MNETFLFHVFTCFCVVFESFYSLIHLLQTSAAFPSTCLFIFYLFAQSYIAQLVLLHISQTHTHTYAHSNVAAVVSVSCDLD